MTISLSSGGWFSTALRGSSAFVLAGLLSVGCGGTTASSGGTTTPVKSNGGGSSDGDSKKGAASGSVEEEALVKVRENMFPPVDVGAWVCEPKSWNDQRMALLHCVAPAGTKGLIATLQEMPEVVSAEPAK